MLDSRLLDESVARVLETGLVERVAGELLDAGVAENVADRVLAGQELDRLVTRVLEDPATGRLVAQVLDSRLLDESVARVLQSEELWLVVEEIARSPAVTSAISQQGTGFADQVVGEVGERSRRADAWLERAARRMLHRDAAPRRSREGHDLRRAPAAGARRGRAGGGHRARRRRRLRRRWSRARSPSRSTRRSSTWWPCSRPRWSGWRCRCSRCPTTSRTVLVAIGSVAYVLWSVAYFVGFWSTTGQTPGARLLRFRVCTYGLGPLKPRRALLRFAGLVLAAIPLFAGFLPILFDDRRRGLQDILARTVVVEAADVSAAAP